MTFFNADQFLNKKIKEVKNSEKLFLHGCIDFQTFRFYLQSIEDDLFLRRISKDKMLHIIRDIQKIINKYETSNNSTYID